MEQKQYDDEMKGTLWLEVEPRSEKHPNYKGTLQIEGKKFYLSGWNRTTKTGKQLISLAVQPIATGEVDPNKGEEIAF